MAKKTDTLTEKQIARTYEVVKGFNVPDGDGERRYDPGKTKPRFVMEEDFAPTVWKALLASGAIKHFEDPTLPKEGEIVVAEIIHKDE